MPTGYTAGVATGEIKDFKTYALQCARAFGACIMLRDEPMSDEIPEFKPSDHYEKSLAKATADLAAFTAIYRDTMQRVGAASCLYSEQYFIDLKSILGSSMHLCCVHSRTGAVVAGGVFVEMGGLVHYHLSATANDCLRFGPNKLLIPAMRAWSQGRMNRVLHLGGGVGGAYDSLFHFKAGFSDAQADFYSYRLIVDQSKYESLSRMAATPAGEEQSISTNFFPAYRRPVPSASQLPPVSVGTTVAHDPGVEA